MTLEYFEEDILLGWEHFGCSIISVLAQLKVKISFFFFFKQIVEIFLCFLRLIAEITCNLEYVVHEICHDLQKKKKLLISS